MVPNIATAGKAKLPATKFLLFLTLAATVIHAWLFKKLRSHSLPHISMTSMAGEHMK